MAFFILIIYHKHPYNQDIHIRLRLPILEVRVIDNLSYYQHPYNQDSHTRLRLLILARGKISVEDR